MSLRIGAVTFLFASIERSTKLARARHHHIVGKVFENSIDPDFYLMLSEVSSRFDISHQLADKKLLRSKALVSCLLDLLETSIQGAFIN